MSSPPLRSTMSLTMISFHVVNTFYMYLSSHTMPCIPTSTRSSNHQSSLAMLSTTIYLTLMLIITTRSGFHQSSLALLYTTTNLMFLLIITTRSKPHPSSLPMMSTIPYLSILLIITTRSTTHLSSLAMLSIKIGLPLSPTSKMCFRITLKVVSLSTNT